MAAQAIDLVELLKDVPAGAWVAISESQGKVMSYGIDAQAVLNKSCEMGEEHPLIVRVPAQAQELFL